MRLSTAEKVNAGFVIALAVVAVIAIASIASIQLFLQTSHDVRRTHSVLTELHTMLADIAAAESAQRAFVITGDEQYLEPFHDAYINLVRQIAQIREETVDDSEQQRLLGQISAALSLRLRLMNEVVTTRREAGLPAAAAIVDAGAGRAVMEALRADAAEFETTELARLAQRQRSSVARARLAVAVIALGGLLTILVVFGASVLIRRDFSERRRAEQALRNSETLLSQFMENLPIGVMVVDAEWQPRFANNAAVEIVGPRVLIDTGERPLPLFRADDGSAYPEERTPIFRALAGEHASIDDAAIQVNGVAVPVEVSAAPVYDASGRIAYAIATFSDIGDRRRSEEALRAARDTAETASQTKSDFLARMSHELRTPLNSVIGFANILLKNKAGNLREQDAAYLGRILENGKHLLLLINDILDLSKIESGKIEIEAESVDVTELVRTLVAQWDGQLHEDVKLRTELPAQVEPVISDSGRLRQVLINLIGNAVKFTERGEVLVAVELVPGSRRAARIIVRDTGIGIPADRLDAIFEAFEQAESTTARKFGGTGLGLPISKALCELLGYTLSVESEAGVGTTFTIEMLPQAEEVSAVESAAPVAAPPRPDPSEHDRLVLIIDDEADSRMMLTHYVEEFGCNVIATHSPASALKLARELRPGLITLDLMMPEMNGWEVLRQLKADPELAEIPVVIVSIIAEDSRASLLGAIDLLQKPLDRDTLFAVLRRNIGLGRARILVVEDDADARDLLASMLAEHASELRTAANGQEALGVLRTFEPDLLITDLLMPVMDGMTFLETFRSTPRFQHVPVIVITAKDLTADEMERLSRHTAAVLQKGNALEPDLRRVLGSVLESIGSRASATEGQDSRR
jgi:PAS domain S-box-containing protein